MKADIKLSTRFLTAQNAHQVGLLVTVAGEAAAKRTPINVALVLDRSGSMSGAPLAAAREAAVRFARFLGAEDRLTVLAFDDEVHTIYGPAPGGDETGGSTNLSGAWLAGRGHVAAQLGVGINRVVLLTDGMANVGIVEPSRLVELARGAASQRVSTTCIGFGAEFNEDLLRDMAAAGGANYWYVERDDQMAGIFDEEIEGLVSLAAQNLEVEVRLSHPGVAGVSLLQPFPVSHAPDGRYRVVLGDLYATSPRVLALLFHVEDVGRLGETRIAEVQLAADVVWEDGVEHRLIKLPVVANLDRADHVEPEVERTFVRFEAARAREEAVKKADAGDFDGAARALRAGAKALLPYQLDPALAEEAEDLTAEAERLETRRYESRDRKYHQARAVATMDSRVAYAAKISRRRTRRPRREA
jgi:Ca-activated chloride channel family protein